MNLSKFFIDRPIFAGVLSLLIFLGGLIAVRGLPVSEYPNVVPPSVTLWDAAAPVRSQVFLMVGTMFLLPVILGYVMWSYWVFRGKVRAGGYHG